MTEPGNSATSATQTGEQSTPVSESTPRSEQRQAKRDEQVRTRLKAAEAELTTVRARYESLVTAEVHRLLSGVLSDPAMAIRAAEVSLDDFIDAESGKVSEEAVAEFGTSFAKANPGFRAGPPSVSGGHQRPVRRDELAPSGSSPSWHDVLRQRQR